VLELQCVLEAAKRWAHLWGGQHVVVRSDNSSTVFAVNKGTSRSPEMLVILKQLFWYSVHFGFRVTACFLAGKLNVMSDRISRLNEFNSACEAFEMLYEGVCPIYCNNHMSFESFVYLQESWHQA
jgi:hypothetical protein